MVEKGQVNRKVGVNETQTLELVVKGVRSFREGIFSCSRILFNSNAKS